MCPSNLAEIRKSFERSRNPTTLPVSQATAQKMQQGRAWLLPVPLTELLVANPLEFAVKLGHGSGGNLCANIAPGAPRAGLFYGGIAAVHAVCIAFLFAQIQEQSGRGSASQNMIRDGQREVIRISPFDSA